MPDPVILILAFAAIAVGLFAIFGPQSLVTPFCDCSKCRAYRAERRRPRA